MDRAGYFALLKMTARAAALAANHAPRTKLPCPGRQIETKPPDFGAIICPVNPKHYRHVGRKEHEVDGAYWEQCYRNGDLPWDHGEASPGLEDFLAQEKYAPGPVLVPGCGRGHDGRALARAGFEVTGMDISPRAVEEARRWAQAEGLHIRFVCGDFLKPAPAMREQFDWVFEHTCFCAIDPELRDQYVLAVSHALKPAGHLLGVFYHIQPESGPPFGTTRQELLDRLSAPFELRMEKVPRSWPNRQGKELLMLWSKRQHQYSRINR